MSYGSASIGGMKSVEVLVLCLIAVGACVSCAIFMFDNVSDSIDKNEKGIFLKSVMLALLLVVIAINAYIAGKTYKLISEQNQATKVEND